MEWTGSERVASRIELVLERGRDSKRWVGQERYWKRERWIGQERHWKRER